MRFALGSVPMDQRRSERCSVSFFRLRREDRAAARHAMASLMGRMMMFAGVTGIPGLYWAAEKAVNAWMGTDDKPYDMTAAMHKSLQDHMGKTAADSIMTGPVGAVTGASTSAKKDLSL